MLHALAAALPWIMGVAIVVLPVILRALGEEESGNTTVHESGDDEEPGEMAAAALTRYPPAVTYVTDASQVVFALLGVVLLAGLFKMFFLDKRKP